MRFPEFSDEWKQCIIKDFGKVVTGGTPPTSDPLNYSPPKYLWASPGDLGNTKYLRKTKTLISEKGFSTVRSLPKGSILVTCIGLIGKMGIATEEIASNQQINAVIVFDTFSNEYVYYAIYSKAHRFQTMASTQVVPILSKREFERLPNSYPSLAEQRKIAEFLSLIDERIETQRQTIEERKKQKKALLHQIFSQSLRFPEFSDPWQQTTLGAIGEIRMCKRILANQTNKEGGIPFFKIGTIGKKEDSYIPETLFHEYKSKYPYPDKGQILITCAGTIGRCLVFDGSNAYYQDSNIVWIDNEESSITNQYLFYVLNGTDWSKLNTSTIVRLYNDDLRALSISLPSLEEQEKIAELLAIFDERIEAEEALLKCYEAQKRYLLRQMFV